MIIPMLCVTIFVILVVWFLLPRVARLMIHTPTAISIFVCLSMVQLMAVFISMRCTLCGHFLQVALTRIASGRQIAINGHIKFNLTIPLQQLNGLETLVIIMVANKYAFLQITRRRFLNEWEAFKKVISRRNIRRRITIPLTLSNLKLLRRITRTENILHRNFTRRQVAIQNRVASNIGISQSTFSVKVLNLFSRSRRKTNKRKSKHSAMPRNKETRHRMFIGLLNTTRKLA